jgi:four helix bundle protein
MILVASINILFGFRMTYRSFEELDVWKRACQLAVRIYETVNDWRDFGLKDQMQRSSVSIASNIAEGCERGGKDFVRFLRIAQGSAAELRSQTYIAKKICLISDDSFQELIHEQKGVSKMITGLRKSLLTDREQAESPNHRKPKTK